MTKKIGEDRVSKEAEAQKRRTRLFLAEIKARGGYKKIYNSEHTNKVTKAQGVSMDNFYKLLSRMVDGGGLFCKPILLSAILKDMAYPADCLFQDVDIPLSSTTLKLGPGVANELKNIMAQAYQEISKKPYRQPRFFKRIWGAKCILSKAREFKEKNNYLDAIYSFFYQYSILEHRLYPHSHSKDIELVDKLCKHCIEHNSSDSGSLLTLGYLIFEIKNISCSLTYYTGLCQKLPVARKPPIEGFQFKNNFSTTDVLHYLRLIQESFEKVVYKYLKHDHPTVTGNVLTLELEKYFSLTNTCILQCLTYAENCLDKILLFDMTPYIESSSGLGKIDLQFDILVGLNPKVSPHFSILYDSRLDDDFKSLSAYLTNFYESYFVT